MPNRCPESETFSVGGEQVSLQCMEWSDDPAGRHREDHYVTLPPADGGQRTWTNKNRRPEAI